MTERGDMMREVLKRTHEMFASDPLRDGPFYVTHVTLADDVFFVQNFGFNAGGNLSTFVAYKSGWYTIPEEWFFKVLR